MSHLSNQQLNKTVDRIFKKYDKNMNGMLEEGEFK